MALLCIARVRPHALQVLSVQFVAPQSCIVLAMQLPSLVSSVGSEELGDDGGHGWTGRLVVVRGSDASRSEARAEIEVPYGLCTMRAYPRHNSSPNGINALRWDGICLI